MSQKIKVLYLMGWGRSGSTLLANVLGQIEGFLSVGEIQSVWSCGFTLNRTCGCGRPFLSCDFWTRVTADFSQRVEKIQAERWNRLCRKETRTLHAPRFLLPRGCPPDSLALREYLTVTGKLYEAIQHTSRCKVIVDSSKSPFYGKLLGFLPQLEMYILHLIRDPRAAAYSWSVPRPQRDAPMRRIGEMKSSILWMAWNASTEWHRRSAPDHYLRIRYEDFIRRPRAAVEDILHLVREHPAALPFLSESSVFLEPNHTMKGNPCRFRTGRVDLTEDLRWKTEMNRGKRLLVGFIAWPLALRYGYFFPKRASSLADDAGRYPA
jgi:hypothetical protein